MTAPTSICVCKVGDWQSLSVGRIHSAPVCGFHVFWLQVAIEHFALFTHSVCDYMCFSGLRPG